MAVCTLEHYPTHEAARMRLAKLELAEPAMALVEQPDGTIAGGSMQECARAIMEAGLKEDAVSVLAQSLSRRVEASRRRNFGRSRQPRLGSSIRSNSGPTRPRMPPR
jgi:hypothetical protein